MTGPEGTGVGRPSGPRPPFDATPDPPSRPQDLVPRLEGTAAGPEGPPRLTDEGPTTRGSAHVHPGEPGEVRSDGRGGGLAALLRPRLRRVDLLVALLLGLLGFAAVVQVRVTQEGTPLASARQEDLVAILDDLANRNDRLSTEITTLTGTQDRLTKGADRTQAALDETRRRAQLLGVLAGTVPARGPGVLLTVTDPKGSITADVLLDALQELRDAGAEAVQLEGPVGMDGRAGMSVRVVVSTSLLDTAGGVTVDGVVLRAPYRFVVVGDPATMSSALGIPGGVIDTVAQRGGRATVEGKPEVAVDALRALDRPQYARPAPIPGG